MRGVYMKLLSVPCVMVAFIAVIAVDWYYAYYVQFLPDVIVNAWSVVFPFISLFYFVFSLFACAGLYYKKAWGLRLACFMILYGAIAASLSFGLAYRLYPYVALGFEILLIINILALFYIAYYYFCPKK